LYADMGHVGARSIRLAWYGLVLPSLLLNYAGQTALILSGDPIADNIFYRLCPPSLLMPFIGLATAATIIASQAIITGAFSMTQQAIQLGWFPHFQISHTSAEGAGQIYVGPINWALMVVTIGIAVLFGNSDSLAGAYGIAVSLTMLLTTVLMFVAMREIWQWSLAVSLLVAGGFFVIDSVFLAANLVKIFDGGWVPLVLAAGVYTIMVTWRRGYIAIMQRMHGLTTPIADFMARLAQTHVPRVPGTAVFLSKTHEKTPPIIIWHVAHNKSLHRHVVALSIVTDAVPWVSEDQRMSVHLLAPDFWRMIAHYGFMEEPNVPQLMEQAKKFNCDLDLSDITYYVAHASIVHCPDGTGLPQWQERLFSFMQRNASQIGDHFHLPRDAVVEIGRQIEI